MSTPVLVNIENFGDRVRASRKALGFSQPVLANKLGVSNGAVGNWETGPSIPQPETLRKLAAILDVSVSWLLNGDEAHSRGNSQRKDESPTSPRHRIRDHMEKFMATCDDSELSWLLVEVRQKFPLDKFKPSREANSGALSEAQQMAVAAGERYDAEHPHT